MTVFIMQVIAKQLFSMCRQHMVRSKQRCNLVTQNVSRSQGAETKSMLMMYVCMSLF